MEPVGFSPKELSAATPLGAPLSHIARFQDVDAAGVVFFARIIEYFHNAFDAYLRAHGMPLDEVVAKRLWVAPIRESHVQFFKPIRFGDSLSTSLVRSRLEGGDLHLGYRTERSGTVCAVGYTRAVFVDPESFTRAPPPANVVALFARPTAEASRLP